MTTYIEHIVTDVAVEPESPENQRDVDRRWAEARAIEAVLKSRADQAKRISSEGFDD